MANFIGKSAPGFISIAVYGQDFRNVSLQDYLGKLLVLYFYPMDFTQMCSSEIVTLSNHLSEFKQRDCEILGISCDSHFTHLAWVRQLMMEKNLGNECIPLVADKSGKIAKEYGVYNYEQGIATRSFVVIDKDKVVRDLSMKDQPDVHTVEELLGVIDALKSEETRDEFQVTRGLKRSLQDQEAACNRLKSSRISDDHVTTHN